MTEKKSYTPGEFCWVELTTSDWKKASDFYTKLFGWTANAMPFAPDQPPYVMMQINGKNVCAMFENKQAHSAWLSYVAVSSADESAKKAKSLGGKLAAAEPYDVMDVGRMTTVEDPAGAKFAIWQAKRHKGADIAGEPNTVSWNELTTNDVAGAKKFYTGLFGWKLKESPEYTEVHVGATPVGGIFEMPKEMQGTPPYWMPYFAVSDCDASTKKAKSLGAKAWVEPKDIPNTGRFAVLADPFGAPFAIIKLLSR